MLIPSLFCEVVMKSLISGGLMDSCTILSRRLFFSTQQLLRKKVSVLRIRKRNTYIVVADSSCIKFFNQRCHAFNRVYKINQPPAFGPKIKNSVSNNLSAHHKNRVWHKMNAPIIHIEFCKRSTPMVFGE